MRKAVAIVTLSALAVQGCGAPTKSAGDVAYLFSVDAQGLDGKVEDLCEKLADRGEPPTLRDSKLELDGCRDAGRAALNLREIDAFSFLGLDGDVPKKDKAQVISRNVRSQVWLGKSLLGLAAVLGKKLKAQKAKGAGNKGLIDLPEDETQGVGADLARSEVEVLEEPAFDLEKMTFSAKIRFTVTGIVAIDNTVEIAGGLIDNRFAVTARTTKDQPYEKSLVKRFEALILVVPHASDVYLDLFVDVDLYNPGIETAVNEQLNQFLGSGLKKIIDGFFTL